MTGIKSRKGWKHLSEVILSCKGMFKAFPGVQALDDVGFELRQGEVHALCGENGAGKSTLIKIISGIYEKDAGEITYQGKSVNYKTVQECRKNGISIIPQELQMAPALSVAENIFMTGHPTKRGIVDWKAMWSNTRALQEQLGSTALSFQPNQRVSELSMGHRQLIEIMKAIATEVKVIAFDEPTSSLSDEEVEQLFKLIERLKQKGISIIYVTHRLKEIFTICDRVTVLKDGKYVGTENISDIKTNDVVSMMVGRDMKMFEKVDKRIEDVVMEVKNLTRGDKVKNMSFNLKKGEILGIFGIVGSGRTEMARILFGLDKRESGQVFINGNEVKINHPRDAVDMKLGFVSEDRRGEGLAVRLNVSKNMTMPFLKRLVNKFVLSLSKEAELSNELVEALNIKTPGLNTAVENLSGGNQQKIVISKWMGAQSEILIFDEPTRGIDVGAKAEIYRLMEKLTVEGKSIIMISSELPEVLAMSDRMLVFRDGAIVAELENVRELSEEDVMHYAIGTSV